MQKTEVIIIGAGPAGLAAAYELSRRGKKVIVLERGKQVGGISQTIKFKENYFDVGGHRFHTRIPEVKDLWEKVMGEDFLTRKRLSRIYFNNKFFNYPLAPANAFFGLGIWESISIVASYLNSKIFPYPREDNLEEWVSNRFGKKLFRIFFKSYTEKLWGIPCREIKAEWAAQRISGLSLSKAIKNAFFGSGRQGPKTLIDKFQYPKYGPGMMYEKMAQEIENMGGQVIFNSCADKFIFDDGRIKGVATRENGEKKEYMADAFISSMPLDELVGSLRDVSQNVIAASQKLKYRSFVSINVILNCSNPFPDNWIYIHSPEVAMGRIQNYRNWSPYSLKDKNQTILGLEYFCSENDDFWKKSDQELINLGLRELEKIRLGRQKDYVSGFVIRVPKAYPVYEGNYSACVNLIRIYLKKYKNLQTIGRAGLFRYNNMDHSIQAGLYAARNITGGSNDVWSINA